MKIKKYILFLLWNLLAFSAFAQQDAQFSQYIFNNIYINPAYAGYKKNIYLQSFYRNQWTGLEGAPKTLSVAIDAALNNDKVGISFLTVNDKIGAQSNMGAYLGYAYHLQTNKDKTSQLSFGLSLGFIQSKIDGAKLNAEQMEDDYLPMNKESALFPDAKAGILFDNETFFAGLSFNNILASWLVEKRNVETKILIPKMHLYFSAGAIFPISDDLKLKPVLLIKDDMAGPSSLDLNAFLLIKEKVWIGTVYRTGIKLYNKANLQNNLQSAAATGLMTEFFISNGIRLGYAYDYALNKLKSYNNGTHEISVGIYLKRNSNHQENNIGCYF